MSQKDEKHLEEITRWTQADMNRWEQRNQRFRRDQEAFQLKQGDLNALNNKDIIVLPDPRILVKKVSRLIARHPNVIEVPPSAGVPRQTAQKIENFLYAYDQAVNQQWAMGLHNPYRYDQAAYTVLRGWLAERTMLRPEGDDEGGNNPAALFDHQVFDPACIYPFAVGNEIVRVSHVYQAAMDELAYEPAFKKELKKLDDDDLSDIKSVTVKAVYWQDRQDGGWWHAVVCACGPIDSSSQDDVLWLKKPAELGYNPWTILTANGVPYRNTPWDEIEYLEHIGTGILDDAGSTYTYLNRMATKLSSLLALEANPPITIYTTAQGPRKVSFEPGARNVLAERDKLEAHRIGPALGDYQLLWDQLQKRANRAGLPDAFYSEYGGESGFSATLLMAAGKDILFPFTEAINTADALKYRKVLEIYRDFGPTKPLQTKVKAKNEFDEFTAVDITAQEIKDQGTYVTITREDMTPQELATQINLALAMLREKAISLHTARRDYIKLKNPDEENVKVLGEQVYLNEDVIKALVPVALSSGNHDLLRQVWEAVQNQMPAPGTAPGSAAPGQPAAPQMGPPQINPGGAPPGMGLPTQALPPTFTGQPGMNAPAVTIDPMSQMMNPVLQMLMSAQGGAGGGGLPPVPGTLPMPPVGIPLPGR